MNLLHELKRRNVLRAGAFYAATAWLLAQVVTQILPVFNVPAWTMRWVIVALVLGFPFAIAFAWFYAFTPQGLKRESEVGASVSIARSTGKRMDRWIIAVLAFAVVLLLANTFVLHKTAGSVVAPAAPAKSIAVLPFTNLSGDPKNAYFSDGITEEILNALTQVPGLKVAGRTSAFQFKGKNEDLRKVGETLGVATVLEGSVQKSGNQVRITAQLVDVHDGYQLWSEKYDRKLTSIFAVEDEISTAIADKLQVQLAGGGGQPLVRGTTDDPQAHALYLQGIAKIAQRGPALKIAVALLERATARDPDYAAAWAGLSQSYELLPWYNLGDWQPSLDKAESAAQRALALDPQLGEAHAALANVLRDRLDFAGADEEYRQALALNPGSSEIHNQYAQLLGAIEQFDAAIKQERMAVALDPLAANPRYMLGILLAAVHRYTDAATEQERVLAQTPNYYYARFELMAVDIYTSNYVAAEKAGRAAARQAGEDPETIAELVKAVADKSLRLKAVRLVDTIKRKNYDRLGGLALAFWDALLGANEKSLDRITLWANHSEPGRTFADSRLLWSPAFDPIRNDPRFQAVLKKMGLPYTSAKAAAP